MAKRRSSEGAGGGQTQLFSLRLPPQLWKELAVFARLEGKSMNAVLCEVIETFWKNEPRRRAVARLVKTTTATTKASRRR